MKGYCTAADVRLALAPLSDYNDVATAAKLTDPQIEDAISEAEGIVDSYTSARYTIPLVGTIPSPITAPAPVRGLTRSVAAYLAALTFRKNKDLTEDDPIRLRYGVALGVLTSIRDRKANLDEEVFLPVDDESQGVTVVNLYEGTLFTMADVGLVPDPSSYSRVAIPLRGW